MEILQTLQVQMTTAVRDNQLTETVGVDRVLTRGQHAMGHVDEPHGSLFMYFRIFAPLADNHVIASHVTGVTRPIPTFSDQFRSFPLICDDFRSFPMIFTFGRRLTSIANPNWVPRDTAEVLQFGKTVAEDTGMLVYQNS